MKTKTRGITAKTIGKLTRLARELEAANGLRIEWSSGIFEGRRYFHFEPVPIRDQHQGCFCETGFAYSVADALRTFYFEMGQLLNRDKLWSDQERSRYCFLTGLCDYRPARFNTDASANSRPGLHGRRVVLVD